VQYLKDNWETCLPVNYCPACRNHDLRMHATYKKYYYDKQIQILRLRCKHCGRTHAIIPSFSLPGTSIGIREAEEFIHRKEKGSSSYAAQKGVFGLKMHESYSYKAQSIFTKYFCRAKALFPSYGNPDSNGLGWIQSVLHQDNELLLTFNIFCLSHKVNAVFCNRVSILLFPARKQGKTSSHNIPALQAYKNRIDSS
jgi:hypothetical protein